MSRYSKTQIVIPDSTLQSRQVSGVLRVGDIEHQARAFRILGAS